MASVRQYICLSMPIDSDAISIDGFECGDPPGVEAATIDTDRLRRLTEVRATKAA